MPVLCRTAADRNEDKERPVPAEHLKMEFEVHQDQSRPPPRNDPFYFASEATRPGPRGSPRSAGDSAMPDASPPRATQWVAMDHDAQEWPFMPASRSQAAPLPSLPGPSRSPHRLLCDPSPHQRRSFQTGQRFPSRCRVAYGTASDSPRIHSSCRCKPR